MRSLFRYLLRNHAFVLFILLETLALVMVFNYNSFQRAKYLNSANRITGNIYNMYHSIARYFDLVRVNRELAEDNARLRSMVQEQPESPGITAPLPADTPSVQSLYRFTPAKVINNSVNRPFNYITLNKGRKHGIQPDQGIMSARGIVGVVAQVSESYAMGLSVLNPRWSVSAKLKNAGYYGSLVWQGDNHRTASLNEIPLYANIAGGDTVVTSGYSSLFPEGIPIGTIREFSRPEGENYYSVTVELAVDFKAISYVEVIEYTGKPEVMQLENRVKNDQGND
jgi:rod shape-determining protein MreC